MVTTRGLSSECVYTAENVLVDKMKSYSEIGDSRVNAGDTVRLRTEGSLREFLSRCSNSTVYSSQRNQTSVGGSPASREKVRGFL